MLERDDIETVGDEETVAPRKNKARDKREKELNDLRELLKTYGGRAFLWRVLTQTGLYRQSFTGDEPTTYFNEGKRRIGLWLLDEIFSADKGMFNRMQNEAEDRGERR